MAYICELPDLHLGPCMSQSVRDSMQRRVAWEGENPDQVTASHPSQDIIADDPRGLL